MNEGKNAKEFVYRMVDAGLQHMLEYYISNGKCTCTLNNSNGFIAEYRSNILAREHMITFNIGYYVLYPEKIIKEVIEDETN